MFNAHAARTQDLVVPGIDSVALLREGHQCSEQAWEEQEEEEFELLPAAATNRPSQSHICRFNPLSQLLISPPQNSLSLPPPYVADMTCSTQERRKTKGRVRFRRKRAEVRATAQAEAGTSLKVIAVKKRNATKANAIIAEFLELVRPGGWVGSRSMASYPKIMSVLDVFRISGLRLITWDAR